MLSSLWRSARNFGDAFANSPVVRFIRRHGAIMLVAALFLASFLLGNLYHLADDLEAARRLHLFAKYVLVSMGFGLAVFVCPREKLILRLMLALFFVSETWDGVQYAVCRLSSPKDTTAMLAQAWNSGIPHGLCVRVFGESPLVFQLIVLTVIFLYIVFVWKTSKAQ